MDGELFSASQLEELTYLRPCAKDFTLDDNLSAVGLPANNGSVWNSPEGDLGALGVLPPELLQMLLSKLDFCTLMEFRRVNRRASEVVESLPQYKAVTTYAPNVLRGILSVELSQRISCETVYEKLRTAECEQCGDFGGYLYILTCRRVCFLCLSDDKRNLPLLHSHAIRKFGVNRQILHTLPRMRSIPGTYSPNEKKSRKRLALVDSESARLAGITLHGSSSAMERHVSEITAGKLREFKKRGSQAAAGGSGTTLRRLRQPRTEDLFDGRSGNPMRFMAIIRMPWLNRISQELQWGFHCAGCQDSYFDRPLHFRRQFTVASFREHLRQHGKIRDRKHHLG